MTSTNDISANWGQALRDRLPRPVAGTLIFIAKQAWACLFGISILLAVIITKAIWADDWAIARYDALVVFAVLMQAAMLLFKLETWAEAKVILLFHITGTSMEFFKVSAGSWSYPEAGILMVMGVPLFSGFMYASVGSYIARVIRVFDIRFTPYPPFWMTAVLAVAIYVNFFAHHFVPDIRYVLFAATVLLFGRTMVRLPDLPRGEGQNPKNHLPRGEGFGVPLPLAALAVSFALWLAENVGTLTGTWTYAGYADFDWTSLHKMGSWYLLIYVAFVTVTIVIRDPLDIKQTRATSERP